MRWALVGGLIVLLLAPGAARGQTPDTPLAEGRRTLMVHGVRYGVLPDDDPTVLRIREIFQKIVRAAGRRPGLAPEVHVLDTPRVVAEALRGGLVVVSRGLVDLARADEHALAFVLGHELAHGLRDHHGILESLGVFGASVTPGQASPASEQVVRAYHAIELDADRLGVLFSALAGYRASAAIPMLVNLVAHSTPDTFHPHPRERAAAIRDQITEVTDHLEVFHAGLFLLGVGRYLEAAQVLEHFLALFPSREVMSAIGVAYHKEALSWAPAPEYRHLLVVDAASRAPQPRGAAPHPAFKKHMELALHYYTLAADADPTYAPALNNLAAAYLDLDERELALGWINRALKQAPESAVAYNNRALAWLAARDYARAEQDLLAAARLGPALPQPALNLARLYETRGRADEARRWRARVAQPTEHSAAEKRPEALGSLVPGMPAAQLAPWDREPGIREIKVPLAAAAGRDLALVVAPRRGATLLVRGGTVEAIGALPHAALATAAGVRPGDRAAKVEATYGRPPARDDIHALSVWSYPSRALVVLLTHDRVQGIWVGRPRGGER